MNRQSSTEEIDADDELLTSYLDQELTPEDRTHLERRLVDEEGLRERLAGMRRAWELLDEFPETPLNQNFTRSTLEMVALDIERDRGKGPGVLGLNWDWLPNFSTRTKALVFAGLAVLIGSLAGFLIRDHRLKNEASQYAIASVLPLLQDFPDLEGLQALLDTPQWKKLLELEDVRDRVLTDFPAGEDVRSVQNWIGRLDFHQKELLFNQKQSLDRMPISERRAIEDSYQALKNHPNADELRSMAVAMYGVLSTVTEITQAEIRSLQGKQRLKALSQEACFKLARLHGERLTHDEKLHLGQWAHVDLVNQLRYSPAIPSSFQDAKLEQLFAWTLFSPYSTSTFTIDTFADPEALTESLFKGLTPETIRLFQGVAPKYQMIVIANWVLSKNPEIVKKPNEEEMYERYKMLKPEFRDRIDMRRPEEARLDMEGRAGRARRPGQDGAAGPGPIGLKGGMMGGPPGFGGPNRKDIPNRPARSDSETQPMPSTDEGDQGRSATDTPPATSDSKPESSPSAESKPTEKTSPP